MPATISSVIGMILAAQKHQNCDTGTRTANGLAGFHLSAFQQDDRKHSKQQGKEQAGTGKTDR